MSTTAKDVFNDLRELGPREFAGKYKKSVIAGAAAGIGLGLYASGALSGGENPYQEANQALETISNTDNLHYQLDLLEDMFWKLNEGFAHLQQDGLSGDLSKGNELIEGSREAYQSVMSNLEAQEIAEVTKESLIKEANELADFAELMGENVKDLQG